ncbi:pyruvate dehydrogenase (acetyl-transferring) E1 component subunit alpha [Paenibacillus sp. N1-5-1-14]|uniref:pyruvate dehydrogenase (acetyl-transferring) E1 component subunit alpha n=1 Tax=Paenibacillus radicibacter TaxID=2972488 RepID=UPI0021593381|nr:pyruvate dehydrogenase (acetyl-transferring) E1 component subunit alpha [Paenibacillus radicibacter]MCR8641815.1 pyruvate dehydrogenase (acetyl-transferring) E1 component subunit alpha [Paenibacillus radicibacter]
MTHQTKATEHKVPELFEVLSQEGELLQQLDGDLSDELILRMYEQMNLVRVFDRKSVHLQRQGRMGTYAPFEGQEASQVGSAMALSPKDWMFPTYRDHAATITHGQPMQRVFLYWMGHMDASVCPDDKRILPQCVPIATQMVHAVGAAWGSKLKGEPNVSIAYFGDGASSEGDFHEALNFAGVFEAPVIFFCQNNGYAISVPFDKQSASRTISQRAAAYDVPGIRVDGNDILAVWMAVRQAMKHGLAGKGPTLIEAITFRYGAHTTADDPKKYRDQEALSEQWRTQRDPIHRLRLFLDKKGLWNDLKEQQMLQRLSEQVETALHDAESYPKTKPTAMFEHVYAEAPWQIQEQEKQMQSMIAQGGLLA